MRLAPAALPWLVAAVAFAAALLLLGRLGEAAWLVAGGVAALVAMGWFWLRWMVHQATAFLEDVDAVDESGRPDDKLRR
jgi:hypothetical protein